MGTLMDKLNATNATKEQIRQAIERKKVTIPASTPLKDYPAKIDGIYPDALFLENKTFAIGDKLSKLASVLSDRNITFYTMLDSYIDSGIAILAYKTGSGSILNIDAYSFDNSNWALSKNIRLSNSDGFLEVVIEKKTTGYYVFVHLKNPSSHVGSRASVLHSADGKNNWRTLLDKKEGGTSGGSWEVAKNLHKDYFVVKDSYFVGSYPYDTTADFYIFKPEMTIENSGILCSYTNDDCGIHCFDGFMVRFDSSFNYKKFTTTIDTDVNNWKNTSPLLGKNIDCVVNEGNGFYKIFTGTASGTSDGKCYIDATYLTNEIPYDLSKLKSNTLRLYDFSNLNITNSNAQPYGRNCKLFNFCGQTVSIRNEESTVNGYYLYQIMGNRIFMLDNVRHIFFTAIVDGVFVFFAQAKKETKVTCHYSPDLISFDSDMVVTINDVHGNPKTADVVGELNLFTAKQTEGLSGVSVNALQAAYEAGVNSI